MCFKRVWKLREVFGVRVTAGHRPSQAQEEWRSFSHFCLESQKLFLNRVKIFEFYGAFWWFCDGISEKILVLGKYKKVVAKSAV